MQFFAAVAQGDQSNHRRWWVFIALLLGEVILTSYAFNFPTGLPEWFNPVTQAKVAAQAALLALVILLVIAWPARTTIFQVWSHASRSHNWRTSIGVNLALFATLLAATVAFSNLAAHASEPPWHWFALYCLLLLVTATSLAVVAAPLTFWRWLVREMPSQVAIAAFSGALLVLAGRLSLEGWSSLAGATLRASHWILTLYETDVVLDVDRLILGVGDFQVLVLKECSGYEGIGLVTAFLAFYCWLMRHQLRFPHALLLLPVGIVIAWSLNALRIALLISIGRHVFPRHRPQRFPFAGRMDRISRPSHRHHGGFGEDLILPRRTKARGADSETGQRVAARTTRPIHGADGDEHHRLALRPARRMALFSESGRGGWHSMGVSSRLWVAADRGLAAIDRRRHWHRNRLGHDRSARRERRDTRNLARSLPTWLVVLWLSCRAFGSVVLVPMAEELAFRGYLQRVLVSRDFNQVAPGQFTWLSFVVTSLLFGMMHQRWIAAALAGALYALLVYRTNRLSDAIAAHATSNLVIFICAVAARQWSLL